MDVGIIIMIALNVLVLSGVYLIVALGLNIIYGLNRILNMAHGAMFTLGAYFGYMILAAGFHYFWALIIAPLFVALVGLIIERPIIAPIRHRSLVYTLIITFGLMLMFDGAVKYFWGPQIRYFELPGYMMQTLSFAGMSYPVNRIIALGLSVVVLVCLMLLLGKTRVARIMRAASRIPTMVSCLGINMRTVYIGTFVLGSALAGIAGVIAGPLYSIYPAMGQEMLVIAFVVVVIGGLGSLRGTVIAAFLVGFVQSLSQFFIPDMAMVAVYMMMALVLAFLPRGLLGEGRFE